MRKSTSLEPLISQLEFVVQKLWPKNIISAKNHKSDFLQQGEKCRNKEGHLKTPVILPIHLKLTLNQGVSSSLPCRVKVFCKLQLGGETFRVLQFFHFVEGYVQEIRGT